MTSAKSSAGARSSPIAMSPVVDAYLSRDSCWQIPIVNIGVHVGPNPGRHDRVQRWSSETTTRLGCDLGEFIAPEPHQPDACELIGTEEVSRGALGHAVLVERGNRSHGVVRRRTRRASDRIEARPRRIGEGGPSDDTRDRRPGPMSAVAIQGRERRL